MIALRRRDFVMPEHPIPYGSYLHCPWDGEIFHCHGPGEIVVPEEVERACREHLEQRHRWRLRLYERFGWEWPIRGFGGI